MKKCDDGVLNLLQVIVADYSKAYLSIGPRFNEIKSEWEFWVYEHKV